MEAKKQTEYKLERLVLPVLRQWPRQGGVRPVPAVVLMMLMRKQEENRKQDKNESENQSKPRSNKCESTSAMRMKK